MSASQHRAAELPGGRVTLRGRLTAAFLAVVLGPVLLGAFFVGATVAAVDREPRPPSGSSWPPPPCAPRSAPSASSCAPPPTRSPRRRRTGRAAPPARWSPGPGRRRAGHRRRGPGRLRRRPARRRRRGPTAPADRPRPRPGPGLAVRVELRDRAGAVLGAVAAAQPVDPAFVARLAAVTGVGGHPARRRRRAVRVRHTTESTGGTRRGAGRRRQRSTASGSPRPPTAGTCAGSARRAGQPLPLVLSVPSDQPPGLYAVLVAAVVLAALLRRAGRLVAGPVDHPAARRAGAAPSTGSPRGDLAARVPVRSRDEVGRLAGAFNRMTRETAGYVEALTASRDQLRGPPGGARRHPVQHPRPAPDPAGHPADARSPRPARGPARCCCVDPATGVLVGQCAEGLDGRGPADADRHAAGAGRQRAGRRGRRDRRAAARPGRPRRPGAAGRAALPDVRRGAVRRARRRGRRRRRRRPGEAGPGGGRARRRRSACWRSTTGSAPTSSTTPTWSPCAPSPGRRRWRWTTCGCTRRRSGCR